MLPRQPLSRADFPHPRHLAERTTAKHRTPRRNPGISISLPHPPRQHPLALHRPHARENPQLHPLAHGGYAGVHRRR